MEIEAEVDYDIIMLALPRWDGQYSSTAYSLAQELSTYTRVFYVDNPFTFKDYVARRHDPQILRRKDALLHGRNIFHNPIEGNNNLIAVTPRLTFPINWMSAGGLYDFMSGRNDKILFDALSEIIKAYQVKKFVFINSFNPLFARHFPAGFRPSLNIYHCVDDISKSEYIAKHGTRLEREAVRKADLTLVTSMELKRLKEQDSAHVYYHPNAANVALFQHAYNGSLSKPADLNDIPSDAKVILYMGNICHRIDYELLKKIASRHNDKYLVMVGPKSNDSWLKYGLDKLENVIFTGTRPLGELPRYVAFSHCCIIPFLCIPLTRSIYPLKINEYLSGGKPVVTTNFSEDIANFGEVAHVSEDHDAFVAAIGRAIAEDSPEHAERRVKYAAGNNWQARAKQLVEIIAENLVNNGRAKQGA